MESVTSIEVVVLLETSVDKALHYVRQFPRRPQWNWSLAHPLSGQCVKASLGSWLITKTMQSHASQSFDGPGTTTSCSHLPHEGHLVHRHLSQWSPPLKSQTPSVRRAGHSGIQALSEHRPLSQKLLSEKQRVYSCAKDIYLWESVWTQRMKGEQEKAGIFFHCRVNWRDLVLCLESKGIHLALTKF